MSLYAQMKGTQRTHTTYPIDSLIHRALLALPSESLARRRVTNDRIAWLFVVVCRRWESHTDAEALERHADSDGSAAMEKSVYTDEEWIASRMEPHGAACTLHLIIQHLSGSYLILIIIQFALIRYLCALCSTSLLRHSFSRTNTGPALQAMRGTLSGGISAALSICETTNH